MNNIVTVLLSVIICIDMPSVVMLSVIISLVTELKPFNGTARFEKCK
jgi:hypothetical protein